MGLVDYFIPDPPIECPRCEGIINQWQGKHCGDMGAFVWQQGMLSPVDQRADEEMKLDSRALRVKRLEPEFSIYGGECLKCGFVWWDSAWEVHCKTEQNVWTQTEIVPPPISGEVVQDVWIVCQGCFTSWKARPKKTLYLCSSCQKLVRVFFPG